MCDQNYGLARLLPKFEHQILHLFARQSIQLAQRFIHQNLIWFARETSCPRDPLLYSSEEFMNRLFHAIRQTNDMEQMLDLAPAFRAADTLHIRPGPLMV